MAEKMWRTILVEPRRFVREQVEIPAPGPGEVLARVTHVGVCGSDISAFHGRHPYIHCPIVLGHEFSGVVAENGPGTDGPAPGTRVAVIPHRVCGQCRACRSRRFNLCESLQCIGAQTDGAHAEYVTVPLAMAVSLPEAIPLEQAALLEPAAVAYHGMNRAGIGSTDKVLVVGAGPIGVLAMQCAKALGACSVTIADVDPYRLELARSLGANGTIDVSNERLESGLTRVIGDPKGVDVLVDCVGGRGQVLDQLIAMAPRGSRVLMVGVLGNEYEMPHLPDFVEHELTLLGTTMYVPDDYRAVIMHLAAGRIRTEGIITHTFSHEEILQAFAMMTSGKQRFFKVILQAG